MIRMDKHVLGCPKAFGKGTLHARCEGTRGGAQRSMIVPCSPCPPGMNSCEALS